MESKFSSSFYNKFRNDYCETYIPQVISHMQLSVSTMFWLGRPPLSVDDVATSLKPQKIVHHCELPHEECQVITGDFVPQSTQALPKSIRA